MRTENAILPHECQHRDVGVCPRCARPMRPKYDGDNRLLAPLGVLTEHGKIKENITPFTVSYTLVALANTHKCTSKCSHA